MREPTDFLRVFDLVDYQIKKYPQRAALNYFENDRWQSTGAQEIMQKVNRVSCWLIRHGFSKGDCIAIVPRMGSPLWMMIDFACQQIGLITVPIHPTATTEEMKFILDEVQAKICITVDLTLRDKVKSIFQSLQIYHLGPDGEGSFPGLQDLAASLAEETTLNQIKDSIQGDDTLCIMYTSGTSGTPKGAILTHHNVVCNIKSILPLFPIRPGDRILSFLPFSHVFERTSCYAYFAFGASLFLRKNSNDSVMISRLCVRILLLAFPRLWSACMNFWKSSGNKKVRSNDGW